MKDEIYYPIDKQTREVLAAVKAEYRGGIHHIPKDALQSEPLPSKNGFIVVAVLDDSGKAINSKYIEDNRNKVIYSKADGTKTEQVYNLGPIKEGYTLEKPLTSFDEWINDNWVTNESNKYIAEYDAVDARRRTLFAEICDPLKMEALDMQFDGKHEEAEELQRQARAAKEKIKLDNPWPIRPI